MEEDTLAEMDVTMDYQTNDDDLNLSNIGYGVNGSRQGRPTSVVLGKVSNFYDEESTTKGSGMVFNNPMAAGKFIRPPPPKTKKNEVQNHNHEVSTTLFFRSKVVLSKSHLSESLATSRNRNKPTRRSSMTSFQTSIPIKQQIQRRKSNSDLDINLDRFLELNIRKEERTKNGIRKSLQISSNISGTSSPIFDLDQNKIPQMNPPTPKQLTSESPNRLSRPKPPPPPNPKSPTTIRKNSINNDQLADEIVTDDKNKSGSSKESNDQTISNEVVRSKSPSRRSLFPLPARKASIIGNSNIVANSTENVKIQNEASQENSSQTEESTQSTVTVARNQSPPRRSLFPLPPRKASIIGNINNVSPNASEQIKNMSESPIESKQQTEEQNSPSKRNQSPPRRSLFPLPKRNPSVICSNITVESETINDTNANVDEDIAALGKLNQNKIIQKDPSVSINPIEETNKNMKESFGQPRVIKKRGSVISQSINDLQNEEEINSLSKSDINRKSTNQLKNEITNVNSNERETIDKKHQSKTKEIIIIADEDEEDINALKKLNSFKPQTTVKLSTTTNSSNLPKASNDVLNQTRSIKKRTSDVTGISNNQTIQETPTTHRNNQQINENDNYHKNEKKIEELKQFEYNDDDEIDSLSQLNKFKPQTHARGSIVNTISSSHTTTTTKSNDLLANQPRVIKKRTSATEVAQTNQSFIYETKNEVVNKYESSSKLIVLRLKLFID